MLSGGDKQQEAKVGVSSGQLAAKGGEPVRVTPDGVSLVTHSNTRMNAFITARAHTRTHTHTASAHKLTVLEVHCCLQVGGRQIKCRQL